MFRIAPRFNDERVGLKEKPSSFIFFLSILFLVLYLDYRPNPDILTKYPAAGFDHQNANRRGALLPDDRRTRAVSRYDRMKIEWKLLREDGSTIHVRTGA